ncbi:MAG: ABC transporter permease [Spirochaetes bacterium]|nr:ABC transporter permease [Spirochaetota bacterium]
MKKTQKQPKVPERDFLGGDGELREIQDRRKHTFRRIRALIRKEFRTLFRDPISLGILLFLPLFLLVMFGYAISLDVKRVRTAVLDQDRSVASRVFLSRMFAGDTFRLMGSFEGDLNQNLFERFMQEERIALGVVVPRGFEREVLRGGRPEVQFLIDAANSNTGAAILGYVESFIRTFQVQMSSGQAQMSSGIQTVAGTEIRPRILYNPELRSSLFLVPGLISMLLIVTAVISTSLSIVREKETGTMEQLMTTPLAAPEYILGKIVPPFILSIGETILVLLASYVFFDVRIMGSWFDLSVLILCFLFACLGLGLFLSSLAESQQVAFMMAIILTFLPSYILSGFVFPIRNMPWIIQRISYLVPSRYFLSGLRQVMIRGLGIPYFWEDLVALLLFGGIVFLAGVLRLQKTGIR